MKFKGFPFGVGLPLSNSFQFGGTSGGGGGGSTAADFAVSAARILNRNSPGARASVTTGTGTVTHTQYSTDSTINGTTLVGGGVTDEKDVPMGYSCPIRGTWILTSPQDPVDPTPNLNFANGMSNLFIFEGQVFEFKGGSLGEGSFAIRWSEDGGTVWHQRYYASSGESAWEQFDFGSVATRIVEVIGCDQTLAINGYNFDTGATPPAAYTDDDLPLITMFGDSYVFGQGADDEGAGGTNVNGQNAINGQTRKLGEELGCLQVRNHGLRGNRFSNVQANRSNYADRLTGGIYPTVAEVDYSLDAAGTGARDLWIIPSTINDDSGGPDTPIGLVQEADTADAFRRLRAAQPNAMIMFPIGARAPQFTESDRWLDNYKNGFTSVFGTDEAGWIEQGVYLLDGSRRDGADWTPAGLEGSSAYFGQAADDPGHPTAAGHAYLAEKYAEGVIYMAQQIAIAATAEGYGTDLWDPAEASVDPEWTDNGDGSYTKPGAGNGSVSLLSPSITGGEAYVMRVTIDPGMVGELRVRLGGGDNVSLTAAGDYAFVLDDRSSAGLIIQGLPTFSGTIRDISIIRLV